MIAAIFDMDGTILESMHIWENAPGIFLKGVGKVAEPDLGKRMFTMSMLQGADFMKSQYSLDMSLEAIMDGVNHVVEDFYYHEVQLKNNADHFLHDMKQSGAKMTLATASDRHVTEAALTRLNVIQYFDGIFTCTEIGAGKNLPDIFLAAAEHMGTQPKDTWVFEDSLYALETVKKAGFKAVGVYDESSKDNTEQIKEVSDLYFNELSNFDGFMKLSLYK